MFSGVFFSLEKQDTWRDFDGYLRVGSMSISLDFCPSIVGTDMKTKIASMGEGDSLTLFEQVSYGDNCIVFVEISLQFH